jgi:predicted phosphate transport protein (TIGR00153 family)
MTAVPKDRRLAMSFPFDQQQWIEPRALLQGHSMFGRFMPTEGKFFEYFNQHAECAVVAAGLLEKLVNDLANADAHARLVQSTEKKADRITHDTIDLLHKTFITPLDRDEIHKLITTMDDILDLMEDVAETISLYDVTDLTDEARKLAKICVQCCELVKIAVGLLDDMGNASTILKTAQQIDQLESDADRVMRTAMSKLFREETDVKRLIKLKAIYEQLESITDKCEDVANIIEGIVLENA